MRKLILFLFIVSIASTSCKKDNADSSFCTTAIIQYSGDPAADGLGWILITDPVTWNYEAPDNLADMFKINGQVVDVCYFKTDKDFICFCAPPFKKMVHITSIKAH